MDEIIIKNLKLKGKHGCFAAERDEARGFNVSMKLRLDLNAAAKTDALSDTIDYPAAMGIAEGVLAGESVRLIEKLADKISQRLFERFANLLQVEIEVFKLGVDVGYEFDSVSVRLKRDRSFYIK